VGAILGTIGALIGPPTMLIAAVAGASLYLSTRFAPWTLRGSRWRVPKHWGGSSATRNGAQFGAALGTGFLTELPGIALYTTVACCLTLALPSAILVYGLFGLTRTLPLLGVLIAGGDESGLGRAIGRVARSRLLFAIEVLALLGAVGVGVVG